MMEASGGVVTPGTGVREGEKEREEARAIARRGPKRNWIRPLLLWLAVIAICIFCLFPFYWLINVSLKTGSDLASADLFPPAPTLDNYDSIFKNNDFTSALKNSVIITTVTTILALIVGSFAAYALARLRFKHKFLVLALILSISTFPAIAIAAPIFQLWRDWGLYDTRVGLILPYLAFALPLAIYILTSFFKEIPKELEEAALVDGATYFQAFRKVILPLAAPGLVTAGLLTAFFVWNEFLLAVTLTSSPNAFTVPVSVANFTGSQKFEIPLGTISAASVVITIPLVAAVIIFQKRIVAGLTAGAVKG
jgi:multiple sugar transport system permease protein